MPARPQGELKLSEFEYLTPCFEWSVACNLDWAAVAAIGTWFAAIATFIAVLVALKAADKQSKAAEAAVIAERVKAEYIQGREWAEAESQHHKTAIQLAQAFSHELAWARRQLVARLVSWNPFYPGQISPYVLESYANEKPFTDLAFLQSCSHRLQGFKQEDAFDLLRVLTEWQFFNGSIGISLEQIRERAQGGWKDMSHPRVTIGLEILDLIESTIERMKSYRENGEAAPASTVEQLPERVLEKLERLRTDMKGA